MAEYIEKEQIKYHRERVLNQWSGSRHTDCDVNYKDIVTKEDINNISTADVVERSKIDEAIEEMESNLVGLDTWDIEEKREYYTIKECIEILKRNLGE